MRLGLIVIHELIVFSNGDFATRLLNILVDLQCVLA